MKDRFVSCDWGTSHFRLRLADRETAIAVSEYHSDQGVGPLAAAADKGNLAAAFQTVLLQGIAQLSEQTGEDLKSLPLVISGMASSSIGWLELPYAPLPFALDGRNCVSHNLTAEHPRLTSAGAFLLSGARSQNDVMRGEETEILGVARLLTGNPILDHCLVVLPGTHSKHVELNQGQIVNFQTYMTGEIYEVLGTHSVLRHSLPAESEPQGPLDLEAFSEGVGAARKLSLSSALFHVRTRQVLDGCNPTSCAAFLSGTLIGAELMILTDPRHHNLPVVLCASEKMHLAYQCACEALELMDRLTIIPRADVARLSVLGQSSALSQLAPPT